MILDNKVVACTKIKHSRGGQKVQHCSSRSNIEHRPKISAALYLVSELLLLLHSQMKYLIAFIILKEVNLFLPVGKINPSNGYDKRFHLSNSFVNHKVSTPLIQIVRFFYQIPFLISLTACLANSMQIKYQFQIPTCILE